MSKSSTCLNYLVLRLLLKQKRKSKFLDRANGNLEKLDFYKFLCILCILTFASLRPNSLLKLIIQLTTEFNKYRYHSILSNKI